MDTLKNLLSGAVVLTLAAVVAQGCASPDNSTPPGLIDASLNGNQGSGGSNNGSGGTNYATGGDPGTGSTASSGGSPSGGSGGTTDTTASGGSGPTPCRVSFCPSVGTGAPCCMPDNFTCGVDYGMGCTMPVPDGGTSTSTGGDTGSGGGP